MTFKKEYQKTKSSKEETYEQWLERTLLQAQSEHKAALDKALSLQESETMLRTQVRQLTNQRDYHKEELAQAKSSLRNCKDELELLLQKRESLEKHNEELQAECEELKDKAISLQESETMLRTQVRQFNKERNEAIENFTEARGKLAQYIKMSESLHKHNGDLHKQNEELQTKLETIVGECNYAKEELKASLAREYELKNGSQAPEDRLKKSLTELVQAMKALEGFCNKHKAQFPKGGIMQEPKLRTKVDEQDKPYQVPCSPHSNPEPIHFGRDRVVAHKGTPLYDKLKAALQAVHKGALSSRVISQVAGLRRGSAVGVTQKKNKIIVRVLD